MPIPIHERKVGDLRPNQVITTFGPGAIVDALKDSVIVLDIGYWGEKGKRIYDSRLASYFKVDGFFMPCTTSKGGIPAVMFPHMHVCSECGYIFDARPYRQVGFDFSNYLKYGVVCPRCPGNQPAYPARFVVMCEDGHIHDFPWHQWVHRGHSDCRDNLYINTSGNTSTLADIWVKCRTCGKSRNMSGALNKESFKDIKCPGIHPFRPNLNGRPADCSKPVIPSQRGASNVYFPVNRSAISIPPWIDPVYNLIEEHLHDIELARALVGDDAGTTRIYEMYFQERFTREKFDEALDKITSGEKKFTEIKKMEHDAITHHTDLADASDREYFKAEDEDLTSYLKPYFSKLIRITRLREVKVLLGFTRVDAPDPDTEEEQPNIVYLDKSARWLPAAETNGEGIFIEFNRDKLRQWLGKNDVKSLSKKYEDSYKKFCISKNWRVSVDKDAAYVLMHTFAHLLIKQMAMFSGYSSSAIRERIYFGEGMSGVLLYTGSTDKGGSLGGLVELGTVDNLIILMRDMFQEALFCTNDPECLNNIPTESNSNGAACHSCCMISETACENGNRLLDRGLVVPLENREDQAYFKELVMELCQLEM